MLSGLLIILNILVCIALIAVVLMQRSEGGGFAGGSPTGLVTARGASDLLTRTTWVLFTAFLALSLGLTLLGAHDRATSGLIEKLKLQQVNPATAPQTPEPAPPAEQGGSPAPSTPFSPFGAAPAPQAAPSPFSAPAPEPAPKPPHAAKPSSAAADPPVLQAPPPQAAPTTLTPPPPAPVRHAAPAADQPLHTGGGD